MKFLIDLLPVLLFFVAYKFAGIYVATAVAMLASIGQIAWLWWRHRHLEAMHVATLVLILVLGTATLIFKNPIFIKWKPTGVYGVFALLFASSQWLGSRQPAIQRLMGSQLNLPASIWSRLNLAWAVFFGGLGLLNIWVAYTTSENTWVNFKLFGITGLTVIFVVLQAVYLGKYVQSNDGLAANEEPA